MGRRVDYPRMRAIYEMIRRTPGIHEKDIRHQMKVDFKTVRRAIYNMDEYGLLLCEDDGGGLQVYED